MGSRDVITIADLLAVGACSDEIAKRLWSLGWPISMPVDAALRLTADDPEAHEWVLKVVDGDGCDGYDGYGYGYGYGNGYGNGNGYDYDYDYGDGKGYGNGYGYGDGYGNGYGYGDGRGYGDGDGNGGGCDV